jgi:hypothetical protein
MLGDRDDFARPELVAAQELRLKNLKLPHHLITFTGGHEIAPEALLLLTRPAKN